MKVSELTGADLDYWVAKAEHKELVHDQYGLLYAKKHWHSDEPTGWSPSRLWEQAGPIIEREHIDLVHVNNEGSNYGEESYWNASTELDHWGKNGATPLIAAMRAYVAGKFGDEVPELS